MYYNFYPSVEGKTFEEGALRIAAHTDYELFTALFQRHPGLEVCPGKDTDAATPMEGGALRRAVRAWIARSSLDSLRVRARLAVQRSGLSWTLCRAPSRATWATRCSTGATTC